MRFSLCILATAVLSVVRVAEADDWKAFDLSCHASQELVETFSTEECIDYQVKIDEVMRAFMCSDDDTDSEKAVEDLMKELEKVKKDIAKTEEDRLKDIEKIKEEMAKALEKVAKKLEKVVEDLEKNQEKIDKKEEEEKYDEVEKLKEKREELVAEMEQFEADEEELLEALNGDRRSLQHHDRKLGKSRYPCSELCWGWMPGRCDCAYPHCHMYRQLDFLPTTPRTETIVIDEEEMFGNHGRKLSEEADDCKDNVNGLKDVLEKLALEIENDSNNQNCASLLHSKHVKCHCTFKK